MMVKSKKVGLHNIREQFPNHECITNNMVNLQVPESSLSVANLPNCGSLLKLRLVRCACALPPPPPPFKPSPLSAEHFQVEPKDTTHIDSEHYDLPFTQCDSDEITNLSDNLDVLRNDLKQTKSHLQLVKNELKSLQHTTANEHICNNCADLSKELQASNIQMQTMKDEENNHLCEIRDLRAQLEQMSGSRHALQQQPARPAHAARQPDFHNPQQLKYHQKRQDNQLGQWALPPPQQYGHKSRNHYLRQDKTTWYWLLPDKCIIYWH